MKRSIRWPPVVEGGRMLMTPDPDSDPADPSEALRQIIRLNLMDGTSENPWNGPALGTPDQAYTTTGPAQRARVRARVVDLFRRLERTRRAKLASIAFPSSGPALIVAIDYTDLESGSRDRMELTPYA